MSGPYRLLAQGFELEYLATETRGTRVFLRDTTDATVGDTTLPNVGDPWDTNEYYLRCYSLKETYLGGDSRKVLWTASYSTRTGQEEAIDEDADISDLPKSIETTGEYLNIGKAGFTYAAGGEQIKQDAMQFIATGTLRFKKVFKSMENLFQRTVQYAGHCNRGRAEDEAASLFDYFAAGTILFLGYTSEELVNKDGQKRWMTQATYEWRSIGWNTVWNPQTKAFDRVYPLIYPEDINAAWPILPEVRRLEEPVALED